MRLTAAKRDTSEVTGRGPDAAERRARLVAGCLGLVVASAKVAWIVGGRSQWGSTPTSAYPERMTWATASATACGVTT